MGAGFTTCASRPAPATAMRFWSTRLRRAPSTSHRSPGTQTPPQQAAVLKMQDRYGNTITMTRAAPSGNLKRIASPNGRWIAFTYDSANRVTQAKDNAGRTYTYEYDEGR